MDLGAMAKLTQASVGNDTLACLCELLNLDKLLRSNILRRRRGNRTTPSLRLVAGLADPSPPLRANAEKAVLKKPGKMGARDAKVRNLAPHLVALEKR